MQGKGLNQEYQIEKTPVGGSGDEDEGWKVPKKALKGHTEGRRPVGRSRGRWFDSVDRTAERMLKCSTGGQQKICICMQAENRRCQRPSWAVAPWN